MLKAEAYKIMHSINLLFLIIVIFPIAIFLGANCMQMGITTGENLLSVIFVSSSAVLMLYIAVFASMYLNRDYASNNYRVFVGIGISRRRIIFSKYLVFLIISTLIILIHALTTAIIPCLLHGIRLGGNQYSSVLAYIIVYDSIISTVFLVAIIGRTLIRSILLNIVFIILSSVSVVLLGSGTGFSLAFPILSLQSISNSPNVPYISIVLVSLLYMFVTYGLSHFIFMKQEL